MSSVEGLSNAEILNNYINAQAAQSAAAEAEATTNSTSLWGNFDTFLKILTAQLQNQDPTAPVDPSEFTNQLVQYAEVEQQISSNDKLDSIREALGTNGITPLLSYIGQYVEASADGKIVVQGGVGMLAYNLGSEAQSATLSVQDSSGDVIAQITGPVEKGLNRIAWDGTKDDGTTAADGVYKYVLTVKDQSGNAVDVSDQRVIGQVSSIETQSDGTAVLKIGDLDVSDSDVLSVFAGVGVSETDTADTTTETTEDSSSTS